MNGSPIPSRSHRSVFIRRFTVLKMKTCICSSTGARKSAIYFTPCLSGYVAETRWHLDGKGSRLDCRRPRVTRSAYLISDYVIPANRMSP